MKPIALAAGSVGAAALLLLSTAASQPRALALASPGLWEVAGLPGRPAPLRRCIGDTAALARIEHRGQSCTQVVISDKGSRALIHYTCTGGGFGETRIDVLTPRSLRIQTQGISANAPFNYVVQARRVGSCPLH